MRLTEREEAKNSYLNDLKAKKLAAKGLQHAKTKAELN